MKLYTFPASPGCRPIAMFIADHGMTVEEQVVDLMNGEQYGPAFTAINPNNAVPVLEDGDLRLPECSAILKYLADLVDSPAYPKDLKARAKVNAAMDWVNTGLYPAFGHNLCYPQVLPNLKWEDDKAQSAVLGRRPDALAQAAGRDERCHAGRGQSVPVRQGAEPGGLYGLGHHLAGRTDRL